MLVRDQDLDFIFLLPAIQLSQSDFRQSRVCCGSSDIRRLGYRVPHPSVPMQAFRIRLRQVHQRPLR